MIKINTISNNKSWKNYLTNPSDFIQKKIKNLNRGIKTYKRKTIYCTLLLSGDKEIKKLNKKFRKKNKHTDVLSFPFEQKRRNLKEIYLGDIIISFNYMNKPKNLTNREIKKLNEKFRKKNKSTDILSFPFYNKKNLRVELKKNKEIYLGDIIINLNKIKNRHNKKKFKIEFNKLWIHGLVHLFGHDHKKNKDFDEMQKIEKKFLFYID